MKQQEIKKITLIRHGGFANLYIKKAITDKEDIDLLVKAGVEKLMPSFLPGAIDVCFWTIKINYGFLKNISVTGNGPIPLSYENLSQDEIQKVEKLLGFN